MVATTAPENAFPGEVVSLAAEYSSADGTATVLFELRMVGDSKPFEAAKVTSTSSPARHRWTVALPPGTRFPVDVEFTATLLPSGTKGTSRRIHVHRALRTAIWASYALAKKGTIEKLIDQTMIPELGLSYLDEISSLTGMVVDTAHPTRVKWDRRVPNFAKSDAERSKRFGEVIEYAHARGIQVLVGFEATDTGGAASPNSKAFMTFVQRAVTMQGNHPASVKNRYGEDVYVPDMAVVEAFVDNIVDFMYSGPNALPWDGINFDLEVNALAPHHRPIIRELFHRLHDHPRMKGKWVAYATYGYTDRLAGRKGAPVPYPSMKVQTFDLAQGKRNMVARPMLYEGLIDEPYLHDVIDYAFRPADQGGAGLQRHQLQLGFEGDQQPIPKGKKRTHKSHTTSNARIIEYIVDLLRPEATGLVYFMLFNSRNIDTARMKYFARIYQGYSEGT